MYIVAALIGVHLRIGIAEILGVALAVVLGAACFATFSLVIATLVRRASDLWGSARS